MELNRYDTIIASVYGRGHWLAAELRALGMEILLIDLTPFMGPWPPEDREGPFGFFQLERYSESFRERMAHDDPWQMLQNGFCLWPPSGPLELKGPLTRFHWTALDLNPDWLEALGRGESPRLNFVKDKTQSFARVWPLALAHQLAATRYVSADQASDSPHASPLPSTFGVRFATHTGLKKNLKWLKDDRRVTVTDETHVLDLSFGRRNAAAGIELKGQISGINHFEQLVWTLTAGETRFVSPKVMGLLFPGGVVEPRWAWLRYRVSLEPGPAVQRLPLHVVILGDVESPWTHANLIILQKTPVEGVLDVWVRLPAAQRFNKNYLEAQGQKIVQILSQRLPGKAARIDSLPQEASYTSQQLGEPQFPVWSADDDPGSTQLKNSNIHFESPENGRSHGWDEAFDRQSELLAKLARWWKLKQAKANRGGDAGAEALAEGETR